MKRARLLGTSEGVKRLELCSANLEIASLSQATNPVRRKFARSRGPAELLKSATKTPGRGANLRAMSTSYGDSHIIKSLVSFGFTYTLAVEAVDATGADGLQAALDWLLVHCSTPRGPPPAARPHADGLHARAPALPLATPVPTPDEDEELAMAIQQSIDEQATARRRRGRGAVAADAARALALEEELVQQAIEASLLEQEKKRRQSAVDVAAAEAAFAELSAASAVAAPLPSRPRRDEAAERRMLAAVRAVAPNPVVIAKAAVVLRRRAAAARRRVASGEAVVPPRPAAAAPPTADELGVTSHEAAIIAGRRLLAERLLALQLRAVAISDDGNCQFRALAQQVYGDDVKYHAGVRKAIVERMRVDEAFFGAMFDGADELDAYLATMAMPRTWGDELTLRAAADAFGVSVHVITSTETNWYLRYDPSDGSTPKAHAFLTYVSPVHYDAVAG